MPRPDRPDPGDVVDEIRAALSDDDTIEIERRYVEDTAEEDPGEVEEEEPMTYRQALQERDDMR
jgi:hypothetical protein